MSKSLKYFLIALGGIITSFFILIGILFTIIYFKGFSIDLFNTYIEKKIYNYNPGSELLFKKAFIKYSKSDGLYIEADKLVYFDSSTKKTFDVDSLLINFDLLSLIVNPDQNIDFYIDNIKLFNENSIELARANSLFVSIENINLIKLSIDEITYNDSLAKVSVDYLSGEIRNNKDTILNINNINYINLKSKFEIDLIYSLIRLDIKSIMNVEKTNFYLKSKLSLEDNSTYNIETEFHRDRDILIINEFIGDNIYLSEQGRVNLLEGLNKISVELNFRAKANAFNQLISPVLDLEIKKIVDGFIGWQNFNLNAEFNLNNGHYQINDDSSLFLSGVYDFTKIKLPEKFYSNFKDSTVYEIGITKKENSFDFKINNLKNNFIQLNKGSKLVLADNLDHASILLVTSFKKDLILDYIKGGLSQREANNNKLYDFLNKNLYSSQDVTLSFELEPNSNNIIESIKNINVYSNGKFNSNYVFDDNKKPNYIIGIIDYKLAIEDLKSENISIKGEIDLSNTEAFIRQINLKKKKSEKLLLSTSGSFKNLDESIFNIKSIDSDYDIFGEVRLSSSNHIFVNNFMINNSKNIDITMSGDLSKRILNLDIAGKLIDLSQNKVEASNRKKEYYLDTENYSIETDNVIFSGPVKVNNFKAGIIKKKNILSVQSIAFFDDHKLSYSREKNQDFDTNVIISDDITHFVGDSHTAKKLLSDGSMELTSIRNLKNLEADVNIKLDDFVLIDTPVSLKLLSLPSISGLVSIAEGEPGVRFGYGEIKYIETEDSYTNIEAFAVSDSLGLVMDGSIDRKNKVIDMKGEISPMHLVNAIIQKLPIIGNILVGNEGEGMFSIDFSLKGDQDDPDVDSVPLSIIKPRIIERAVELVDQSN